MAVIFYPDYKEAAERHIETCLKLKHILNVQYQSKAILTTQEEKDKKFLLSNLYYLSGYIIECVYNYAIFKSISFPITDNVHDLKYLNGGNLSHNAPCRVAFRQNKNTPMNTFFIASAGHELYNKMDFFQTYNKIANASLIPLLDGKALNRPCNDLFRNWDVYVRYKIDIALNLDFINAFDFFDLSNEVYEGVIKYL